MTWIIDPIITRTLAHALMEAVYVSTSSQDFGPHRTVEAETALSYALREYAEAIVKESRRIHIRAPRIN